MAVSGLCHTSSESITHKFQKCGISTSSDRKKHRWLWKTGSDSQVSSKMYKKMQKAWNKQNHPETTQPDLWTHDTTTVMTTQGADPMTKRPMEQKLEARNRPTNIRLPDKGAASFQWGEDRLFNKWSWINWVPDGKNESCPLTHGIHKYSCRSSELSMQKIKQRWLYLHELGKGNACSKRI